MIDLLDIYLAGRVSDIDSRQASTDQRLTGSAQKIRDLELRYERLRLITTALWQLLKDRHSFTDNDLKQFVEKVDLLDGKRDGKLSRSAGTMDCPKCSRRVLSSASVCVWCGLALNEGDAFRAT